MSQTSTNTFADADLDRLICTACGQATDMFTYSEFDVSKSQRKPCAICEDDRQYVPADGQEWTTLRRMQESGKYSNVIEPTCGRQDLLGIFTQPQVAIGQRGMLYLSEAGNVLWDCITYLDDTTIDRINKLGGIKVIAISHPHFFSTSLLWAKVFDAELYINETDVGWFQASIPDGAVSTWTGRYEVIAGVTLVQVGGHFTGSAVMHIDSMKAILTADSIMVVADRMCTLMYSYPNMIPMSPKEMLGIWEALKDVPFDAIHGGWKGKDVLENGKQILLASIKRLLEHMDHSEHIRSLPERA